VYFIHTVTETSTGCRPRRATPHNLKRDDRLSAVIFDATVPPGPDHQAVYVAGTALEVQPAALANHLPRAFRPERGARAFTAEELTGEADLRLWVLRVDRWEMHISGAHPTLGSGSDRRTPVDPTE
jgi:hypothetical protein